MIHLLRIRCTAAARTGATRHVVSVLTVRYGDNAFPAPISDCEGELAPNFVYVNTASRSEIPITSRSSRMQTRRQRGSRKTTRRAWPLSTRFRNEKGRQLRRPLWNYRGSLEIKGEGRSSSPLSWGNWKWSAQGSPVIFIDSPATPIHAKSACRHLFRSRIKTVRPRLAQEAQKAIPSADNASLD